MSRKTKPIWEILCLKNENEVKKIKLIFDQVRLKKDQALARKLKLETMLEEYSHKLKEVLKTPKNQTSVFGLSTIHSASAETFSFC